MDRKRFSLELSEGLLQKIDQFKREWGLRSRGAIVERLLLELFSTDDGEDEIDTGTRVQNNNLDTKSQSHLPGDQKTRQITLDEAEISDFDERGALVLVAKGEKGALALDFESADRSSVNRPGEPVQRSSGIDLPGFVRKQSAQLKKSLTPKIDNKSNLLEPLPRVPNEILNQALAKAQAHWLDLYGSAANEAVLEAAMIWIAKDIWPQCDQSDGRLFTWSIGCTVVEELAPTWPSGEASFEKVMVMAGLLEDPFSTSTLELRLPTLIRRFVHRFRKRRQGTSFQTLEHTMTLHGALRLLQLPTSPGHRLTLPQIREAYRVIALITHPDSGGSEDEMRKVNEAYQLLKELYRNQ